MLKEARRCPRRLSAVMSICVAMVLGVTMTPAAAATPQEELLEEARQTLNNFLFDEQLTTFHTHIKKAKAILIVPSLSEAAVGIGGSGGSAVLLLKDQPGRSWSQPAFYSVGTFGLGVKAGTQVTEGVVLVMTKKGVKAISKPSFQTGGGDLKLTILGGGGSSTRGADLVSVSKSAGILVGTSLGKAEFSVDTESNTAFYGKAATPREILVEGTVSNPRSVPLRQSVMDATK